MRLPVASSITLVLKSALPKAKISDFTVDSLGKVPPSFAFHALSYSLGGYLINCGQCEELCPMDIPNALFMHSFAVELQELYGYQAGKDLSIPNIAPMEIILREKIGKIRRAVRVGNFPCPPHQISCCKNETVAQKDREVMRAFQYLLSKKIP